MNFINGPNGSGKSAIVAAIQLCFGARANTTHRFKKLEDLIRAGWEGDAEISITLENDDGYKYEEFGNEITVRRTISRGKGGGFSMLNYKGQVISTKKSDIERMADSLNIQVDNPVSVLDQPSAKSFLQGSNRDKYNFFMRATDLERYHTALVETKEAIDINNDKASFGKMQCQILQEKVETLRQIREQFQKVEELRADVMRVKELCYWACLKEANDEVALQGSKIAEEEENLQQLILACKDKEATIHKREAEVQRLKDRLPSFAKDMEQSKQALKLAKEEKRKKSQAVNVQLEEIEGIERDIRKGSENRQNLTMQIAKMREEDVRRASTEELRKTRETLELVSREILQVQDTVIPRLGEKQSACESKVEQLEPSHKDCTTALRELKDGLEWEKLQLLSIKKGMNATRFGGQQMLNLIDKIRKHKFSTDPIGPIGTHIQMNDGIDNVYKKIIEEGLSRVIHSFIVASTSDMRTLQTLMRSTFQKGPIPSVIVSKPCTRHRVAVYADVLQVSRAILVRSDPVFNVLVDQLDIDKLLIAQDSTVAYKLLVGERGNQKLVHGAKSVCYPTRSTGVFNRLSVINGNTMKQINLGQKIAPWLIRDLRSAESEYKHRVKHTERQIEAAMISWQESGEALKQGKGDLISVEESIRMAESQKRGFHKQKNELERRCELLEQSSVTEISTANIEEEFESVVEELDRLQREEIEVKALIDKLSVDLAPMEQVEQVAQKAYEDVLKNSSDFESEYIEAINNKEDAEALKSTSEKNIEKRRMRIAALKESEAQLKEDAKKFEVEILDKIAKLLQRSGKERDDLTTSRPEITRSCDELNKEYRSLKAQFKEELKRKEMETNEDLETIDTEYRKMATAYHEMEKASKAYLSTADKLGDQLRVRIKKWKKERSLIMRSASLFFDGHMQKRGSSGRLKFDLERGDLSLEVQNDNSNVDTRTNDVKMLSGGEKSYTTLALLLALGAGHDCPFRVMDEFDVFMDEVNRDLAIMELIDFGTEGSGHDKQFVLLTPQNLTKKITPRPCVRVFKVDPPRGSNQGTLADAGFTVNRE